MASAAAAWGGRGALVRGFVFLVIGVGRRLRAGDG
jgi:hypothetical protein